MRMFIPSVLSAFKALLKFPHWFLWKVFKIFIGWGKSIPPQRSTSDSYSPHDSNGVPLQRKLPPTHRYPPQSRSADGDYTAPSQSPHYQTPPQSYQPQHRPNQRPTEATPLVPPNTSVSRPIESTQQSPHPGITTPLVINSYENLDPAGLQDHYPRKNHHDTANRPTSETQILSPDREQSQYDRTGYQDQNQLIQHHGDYTSFRERAKQEKDEETTCIKRSREAYSRGQGALAKELSEQGKQHKRNMEALNSKASAWIFQENNLNSKPGELDLHRLYVKEAISYSDKAIKKARQRGDSQFRFIVGKGLHSEDNVARLKPALKKWMRQHNLPAEVDPQNAGVLIVQLA